MGSKIEPKLDPKKRGCKQKDTDWGLNEPYAWPKWKRPLKLKQQK